MSKYKTLLGVILVALSIFPRMGLGIDMTLCSPLKGQLLNKDVPMAGREIVRTYRGGFHDSKGEQKVVTDKLGRFVFPEIVEKSFWAGIIPHEPVITQSISLKHSTEEERILQFVKRSYELNSEYGVKYGGRPIEIILDTSLEMRTVDFFENPPSDKNWLKALFTISGKIKSPN
jgi:hypothetical protein